MKKLLFFHHVDFPLIFFLQFSDFQFFCCIKTHLTLDWHPFQVFNFYYLRCQIKFFPFVLCTLFLLFFNSLTSILFHFYFCIYNCRLRGNREYFFILKRMKIIEINGVKGGNIHHLFLFYDKWKAHAFGGENACCFDFRGFISMDSTFLLYSVIKNKCLLFFVAFH